MAQSKKSPMPSCNRLLERKWDTKKLQAHHDRLRSIRSTIDSSRPKEYYHIRQNLRKAQIEADRKALIQSHNEQLLRKMHQIMHTTGRVDHRNIDWKPKRSVNFVKKQQESDRVVQENMAMLKRLESTKPLYNTKTWENDYRRHQSLSRSLSILPPIKTQTRRTHTLPETGIKRGDIFELPPITEKPTKGDRPETDQSEIHEEIDVDLPVNELKTAV